MKRTASVSGLFAALLVSGSAQRGARAQDQQDELGFGETASGGGASARASQDELGWGDSSAAPSSPSASPDELGWGDSGASAPAAQSDSSASARAETPRESKLKFQGTLRLRGGVWTERASTNPFAQARTALDFGARYSDSFMFYGKSASLQLVANGHGEYDAAYQYERESYDAPTLDAYEWQAWVAETYVQLTIGGFSLSVGRQVQNLGQAEMLGFIDVLNPRDLREPGLTDLDEIRLPVFMSRLGLSYSGFSLEALVVQEALPSLMPPPLGFFSPFRELIMGDPAAAAAFTGRTLWLDHEPTGFSPGSWQALGRIGISVSSLDLELYGGTVLDRLGALGSIPPAAFANAELSFPLYHSRYTLVATSGALTLGPVVLRWELGAELNKILSTLVESELLRFGWVRRHQLQGLLGLTYFAPKGANLGLEVQRGYVFDAPEAAVDYQELLWPLMSTMLGFRWMQTFGDDVLRLNLISALIGLERWNGGFVRAELARKLVDGLLLSASYVTYIPGPDFGPFYGFERNDRAQLQLRWDFGF